jgi:hypothetical protein
MPDWLPSLPARNLGIALAQFRIVGHEAPRRLAALAWRTEIPDHTDKAENSRQVFGTSDASETQLALTRFDQSPRALVRIESRKSAGGHGL